jgi:nucleotide-binding universal stress UspA family protein
MSVTNRRDRPHWRRKRRGVALAVLTVMKSVDARTRVGFRNILFPTDFSTPSHAALPFALAIARKYASKLNVVHVVPPPPPSPRVSVVLIAAQTERDAQEAMANFVAPLREISCESAIERGDINAALSGIIEAKKIDLVVLGTHGRTGASRFVLGSVAEGIFRRAGCPVLTVGPHVSANPAHVADTHEILYATDFTAHSLAAAPYAISLAQENQARLSLVYVIKNGEEKVPPDMLTVRLQDLVPPDAELSCRPKSFIMYGDPAVEILELARERAADLIVLGVRASNLYLNASMHLPWATAHRVVTQACCPVLTVRG